MKLHREVRAPQGLSPSAYLAAVLIGLLLPVFALGACATLKGVGGAAIAGLIDCGKPALQSAVADIAHDVSLILDGGALDWQAELDEYKAKGLEVLACAVAKVGVALAGGPDKPRMVAGYSVVTPADRAAFYLMSRDLHPSNVPR